MGFPGSGFRPHRAGVQGQAGRPHGGHVLYELDGDPKRKEFLDDLFSFMQKRGTPVNRIPIMAKQVLDLYMLYILVTEKGGLVEVINKKLWREITKGLNLPTSITSAAFTLRTQSWCPELDTVFQAKNLALVLIESHSVAFSPVFKFVKFIKIALDLHSVFGRLLFYPVLYHLQI
ncbi:AT-rich interactive domain-containing protein 3A [Varanus komodoensis]|nr:AT-rich interactive domain-containing protein 3A [Varanus komodoensis]